MEHRRSQPAAVACILLAALLPAPAGERIADKPFLQEVHEGHPLGVDPGANDARAVTLDSTGSVWVATRAGLYRLAPGETGWSRPTSAQEATSPADRNGPAFDLSSDADGVVWAGAWNGVWRGKGSRVEKLPGIEAPVAAICAAGKVVFAAGPDGLWEIAADRVTSKPLPCSRNVRAILPSADGGLWLATAMGLHLERPGGALKLQTGDSGFSTDVRGIAFARDGFLWSAGLGGIVVYNAGRFQAQPTPAVGLPSSDARCVAPGLDGRMWVGTAIGLACFDGRTWSLRHSKRWLVDDDVRDVAFGPDGTGWVATAGGVSALRQRRLTLAEKAEHYHRICAARHVREPGLVEKCRLRVPGDVSTWEPQDDDNDGQYTSMYLAMESFRFAVTKDPEARAAARRAFHALKFLQEVTGTRGFVARTVIPSNWTRMFDPNEAIGAAEWAERRVRDAREKRVELHWRPSKDGKWLWKGDTSSDEITGHMYGYLVYYDLAADGDERKLVSEQVDRVVGTIVDDGFALKDIDGAPTRWGMWAPEKLNGDPDWAPERGVNSVEILSYLKLAKHVTGDPKITATT